MIFHTLHMALKDNPILIFHNRTVVLKDTSNMIFHMKPLVLSFGDARLSSCTAKDNFAVILHRTLAVLLRQKDNDFSQFSNGLKDIIYVALRKGLMALKTTTSWFYTRS